MSLLAFVTGFPQEASGLLPQLALEPSATT
jgi:hypothetical protein